MIFVKKFFCCVVTFITVFGFLSCSIGNDDDCGGSVSVMNWNLETFFDAQFDGNEYKEFRNSKSGWSKEKYVARLDRLATIIKKLDCDVVVMEELEKEGQLLDINNRLSGTFDSSKLYRFGYFTSEKSASIGCGILSRFPIHNVKVHTLDIKLDKKQPSIRPIIQFSLMDEERELVVFVNHWKSKSGSEDSDIWRDYQEMMLSRLIKKEVDSGKSVLACGDFNRSIEEFRYEKNGKCNIVLKGGAKVHSPWFDNDGLLVESGSYWYKDSWEYIDNFFSSNLRLTNFVSHSESELVDSEGRPNRYKLYSGQGYSDHLPITCKIEF